MINQWVSDNNLTKIRYLFFSSHSKKLSRTQIHRIVKEAAERADIKKELTCHSFRSYAVNQIMPRGRYCLSSILLENTVNWWPITRHNPDSISIHVNKILELVTLAKTSVSGVKWKKYRPDDKTISFLKSL